MTDQNSPAGKNKSTPKICAVCGVPAFLGEWPPDGMIRYFCHSHAPDMTDAERAEWNQLLGPGVS
jgi:hypothetical protein